MSCTVTQAQSYRRKNRLIIDKRRFEMDNMDAPAPSRYILFKTNCGNSNVMSSISSFNMIPHKLLFEIMYVPIHIFFTIRLTQFSFLIQPRKKFHTFTTLISSVLLRYNVVDSLIFYQNDINFSVLSLCNTSFTGQISRIVAKSALSTYRCTTPLTI